MLGVVIGAHGVQGEVKIKSFAASPGAFARYGALEDEAGARRFKCRVRGEARGLVIARLDGVATRNDAEALKGVKLFVARAALPRPQPGEYYIADLVGLEAVALDGARVGRVTQVLDYGAGSVLEITRDDRSTLLLPFADRMVPRVDLETGRMTIDPPVEVEARGDDGEAEGAR